MYVSTSRRLACPLIRYCSPPTPTLHWRNTFRPLHRRRRSRLRRPLSRPHCLTFRNLSDVISHAYDILTK